MTEKRFECDKGSRIIIDNETKLHYIMTLDWECSLITKLLNHFADENEQLKKELKEFKDYVFSDEEILCYSCVNCISKGIYEVECSEKGKVDVHGSCFSYWENEL